jgi:prophage regulatory protein
MARTILLRLPDVKIRTGLSRSSIYKKIQEGIFPSPIKIGPRTSAWVESELEDYLQECIKRSRS